jgi:hypothetical protein
MPNDRNDRDSAAIYPFHVGIIAPPGYTTPTLAQDLPKRLNRLLSRMLHKKPITFYTLIGEPVSGIVHVYARESGMGISFLGSGLGNNHLRGGLQIVACCDAVVLVGDQAKLKYFIEVCGWIGMPARG